MWQCYESGSVPFIFDILVFIYLGLLQFVGIILAFQTRKVKINVLNDSKSVTALIYISSIVLVVIVLITFILRGYINISAGVFYGGIILLATIFLLLMFIPKVNHNNNYAEEIILKVPQKFYEHQKSHNVPLTTQFHDTCPFSLHTGSEPLQGSNW